MNIVSSEDAVADSIDAVFAVTGEIPLIQSINVKDGIRTVFNGLVDRQTQEVTESGTLLTVRGRSMECVLLDNEALPQTYCMPSMPLLMKHHFNALGFKEYRGSREAFSGQIDIAKGMSEWAVLSTFCEQFLGCKPKIDKNGIIDVTGEECSEKIYISSDKCLSLKKIFDRSSLISNIYARTYTGGTYEMPLENPLAKRLGVTRIRYVNSVDSKSGTVLTAKNIIAKSQNQYQRCEIDYAARILCEMGSELLIDGKKENLRVYELHYTLDRNGEHTKLYAEVKR